VKTALWTLLLALLSMLTISAVAVPGDEEGDCAAKIAKAIFGKPYSLSAAIEAAEKHTGGKALRALVDPEDKTAIVEVVLLVATDDEWELLEADVDGKTNKVLEVEEYEEEDEGDEDEGEEDEDDEDEDEDDDD